MPAADDLRRRRRYPIGVAVLVLAGVIVGAGALGWAGATLLRPPTDVVVADPFTYATAREGTLGSTLQLNASASWSTDASAANRATGIVTSVPHVAGATANAGDVVYTVDLRPVVVASGSVPSFRTIEAGTQGADVAQLQGLLRELGLFGREPDGRADAATVAAIQAWQRQIGVAPAGVVQPGDIVFVEGLPSRLAISAELAGVGASLGGGEPVVERLGTEPVFTVEVTDSQSRIVSDGAVVAIASPDGTPWSARVVSRSGRDDGGSTLLLAAVEGAEGICQSDCESVPVTGAATLLTADIVTVPEESGVVVPSAAISTTADGLLVVTDDEGGRHEVEQRSSVQGQTIVTGIDPGLRVRVPGDG